MLHSAISATFNVKRHRPERNSIRFDDEDLILNFRDLIQDRNNRRLHIDYRRVDSNYRIQVRNDRILDFNDHIEDFNDRIHVFNDHIEDFNDRKYEIGSPRQAVTAIWKEVD
jgi:hypothetical protein